MKAPFVSAAGVVLMAASAAQAGERATKTLDFRDFTAIEISGAYELNVSVGDDYRIAIVGAPEDVGRADVVVRDGALVLSTRKRQRSDKHGSHDALVANVSMPALEHLAVSGVVDADIRGVDAGPFKVNLSGVGEVKLGGRCDRIDARVSGVGELDARALLCNSADVSLSGMGEASVYAREWARAEVSGMGEINVFGSPRKVEKRGGFLAEITVHE
jgi:hypothetical protein